MRSMEKLLGQLDMLAKLKADNGKFIHIMNAEQNVRHYAIQVRNHAIMYAMRGDNWNGQY